MEEEKIIIYQTEDGQTQIDVRMENETVWLSANQMAILFGRDENNIQTIQFVFLFGYLVVQDLVLLPLIILHQYFF